MKFDPALYQYATPAQKRYLKAWEREGTQKAAADALGITLRVLTRGIANARQNAVRHGWAPEHDMTHPAPDGYVCKGVSTYYDGETGEIRGQWVKTDRDRERQQQLMQEAAEAMAAALPKIKPRKAQGKFAEELMAVIPMGDPHFGMYAWAEECGDDFDLGVAKRDLCAAVDYLVKQAPKCSRCALLNLGDFFHADNMAGMTTKSGHILDMDTRLPKMVAVGVAALRQAIKSALDHHETVEIVNAPGNHDEVLSFVLSILLANVYEDEPRVHVYDQPTKRHYIRFGKVLIGVTHGDKTKDQDLPGIMATERPEDWGETKFRYYFRGHHHHDFRKEYNGCIVEQVRTLAAGDSYAVGHGFLAGRDMKGIVMHKEYGEVSRQTCSIDLLRAAA